MEKTNAIRVWLPILIVVCLIGIVFRTYNFSEYLRFNPDQARDAGLVRDVLEGTRELPNLGPQAGGTEFKLGPVFYYFQIISGKIFGFFPDKLAYPDLIFSILSIPLLYFFLRKFFDIKTVLISTGLFAVSFYAIKYARFAWNPNSMPFFVLLFLYSAHEAFRSQGMKRWLWAALLGISIGVGVQLHSLLLFSLPIVFLAYSGYVIWKKNPPAWKSALAAFLIAFVLNIPQLNHELKTGWSNTKEFFEGFEDKSSREGAFAYKLALNAACHVQFNSFAILPVGSNDDCDFIEAANDLGKEGLLVMHLIFAAIFSLGGYFLMFRSWRKEKDGEKKDLLGLVMLYSGILFAVLVPLAAEISLRFFLVLEFIPFLLLGFWLKLIFNKFYGEKVLAGMFIIISVIVAVNVFAVTRQFSYLAGKTEESMNGFEEITLGEVKFMADFIGSHVGTQFIASENKIYIDGKASEIFKIRKPIQYFTDEEKKNVSEFGKNDILREGDKLFLIDVMKNPLTEGKLSDKNKKKYDIVDEAQYRRMKIYELRKR